ncbi:TetR/AcrR family transcriptional regulator [Micromonospora sp. NPDC003197]
MEELTEVGLGRLSMEGIARRAATAKTTLYRRWSNPNEVLLDALYELYPQEEPSPGADDLRGDLIRALKMMVDWMSTPAATAVVAIIFERQRNPKLVEALYERVFDARGGTFTLTVLRHYAARGHFDGKLITPVVADIGEALVTKRSLDTGQPPTDDELADIVDQAILPAIGLRP